MSQEMCKCELCSGDFGFGCGASPAVVAYRVGLLRDAAEFAVMTIEHAVELDYLGEGSTRGMALDAVEKLKKAAGIKDDTDAQQIHASEK